jgi:hypothetical protein
MSTVEELAEAIQKLSDEERARLVELIDEMEEDDEWDREIEEDARSGRLDRLADEALREHRAGRTMPLSQVISE